jgi:Leucine-rich repeat (LRR) protein
MDEIANEIIAKWIKQPTTVLDITFPEEFHGPFTLPLLPEGVHHLCIYDPIKNQAIISKTLRKLFIMRLYEGKLPDLPDRLRMLYVSNIKDICHLPPNLHTLHLWRPHLESLPSLPKSLKHLQMDWARNIPRFSLSLPAGLKHLDVRYCEISELEYLPPSLIFLRCDDNYIEELPALPTTLKVLKCNRNQLTRLPELPLGLRVLEFGYNQLTCMPRLVASLDKVSYFNNNFPEEPTLPSTIRVVEGDAINYDRRRD